MFLFADCFEVEVNGDDCFALGTCTNKACRSRSNNSTCLEDGQCSCPELYDQELYGKLCHKVWQIDDCFEAEADGKDCFAKKTCSNAGCDNGGVCTLDGSCDCSSLFWGKKCQHAHDCFEQQYSCFFNNFLTGASVNNSNAVDSPCTDAGCLNDGVCQASGFCDCPEGYTGKVCQDEL